MTVDVEVEEFVVEGSTLNITCNARDGNPPVVDDYIWVLTSKYTEENIEPAFECAQGERNCVIYDVAPEHAGKYSCTATNWNGTYETEASAHTTVQCELELGLLTFHGAIQNCNDVLAIKHDPYLFQMYPTGCSGWDQYEEIVYGVLGKNVTLECLVAADPETIAFNWTHTGSNGTTYFEPVVGYEAGFEQYASVNEMEHVGKESYGNVTCTAFNAVGSGQSMVFYVVEHGG